MIKRKDFQSFLNGTPSAAATYEAIGAELEELTMTMNKDVNKTKNILGGSAIRITSGNKEADVSPYIAVKGSVTHTMLQDFIDNDKELDELKTDVIEVKLFEAEVAGDWPAVQEDVYIEVVSYGGNTEGYQIPYKIHYTGTKVLGLFNPTTKVFTAS